MPDVKGVQPVQTDSESDALKEKDKYKDPEKLSENEGIVSTGRPGSKAHGTYSRESSGSGNAAREAVQEDTQNQEGGKKNIFQKAAKKGAEAATQAGMNAVKNVATSLLLKKFMAYALSYMQSLAASTVGWFMGAVMGAWNAITGFGASIVSGFMGFCGTIASFLGIGSTVVAGTVGTAVVSTVVAATVITASYVSGGVNNVAQRDAVVDNCAEEVSRIVAVVEGEDDAIRLDYAMKIYSVLKLYGLPDENIAGVIGNFDHESWIDPTGVETIFSEKYQIGPRKQAAWDADFKIAAIDADYAARFPAIDICGIGLGGFTNGNNTDLLNFADAHGHEWYELETQLAFILCPYADGGYSRDRYFEKWEAEPNPSTAAYNFRRDWEGNTALGVESSIERAEYWFAVMKSWSIDEAYANSVLEMARATANTANNSNLRKSAKDCNGASHADNSSIAAAAVSFAYEHESEGVGNNGTKLYQQVHDAVIGAGDPYYMSCDRCVASAVRWSGADDDYCIGGCSNALAYLLASTKWEEVSWGGDISKLLPGDVLIISDHSRDLGHTIVYTGHEQIAAKFPNAPDNYEIVSASYMERSPGCGVMWLNSPHYAEYKAFRNVEKEVDSKYKNAVAGVTVPSGATVQATPKPDSGSSTPKPGSTSKPSPTPDTHTDGNYGIGFGGGSKHDNVRIPTPKPNTNASPTPKPTPIRNPVSSHPDTRR